MPVGTKVGTQLLMEVDTKDRAAMLAFVTQTSQAEMLRELIKSSLPQGEQVYADIIESVKARLGSLSLTYTVPEMIEKLSRLPKASRPRPSELVDMTDVQIRRLLKS